MSKLDWDRVRREAGLRGSWQPDIEGRDLAEYDRRRAVERKAGKKKRRRSGTSGEQSGAGASQGRSDTPKSDSRTGPQEPRGVAVSPRRKRSKAAPSNTTSAELPHTVDDLRDAVSFSVGANSWGALAGWLDRRDLLRGQILIGDGSAVLWIVAEPNGYELLRLIDHPVGAQSGHVLPGEWISLGQYVRAPGSSNSLPEIAKRIKAETKTRRPQDLRWIRIVEPPGAELGQG